MAVATEPYPVSEGRKGIKLYRWEKRRKKDQGQVGEGMDDKVWKVGLCRMHVSLWDWQELSGKVGEFKSKYGIK